MGRPKGWDLAQLRTGFAGDPEFIRLARRAPDDLHYLAGIGLWTLCLAHAWRDDDDDVGDVLDGMPPALPGLLRDAGLVNVDGLLRGFAKHTAQVREARATDAARKRGTPSASAGVGRSPVDSIAGVGVGVGEGYNGREGPSEQVSREGPAPSRQRVKVRGFAGPFEEGGLS